jgi:hypothetical protein
MQSVRSTVLGVGATKFWLACTARRAGRLWEEGLGNDLVGFQKRGKLEYTAVASPVVESDNANDRLTETVRCLDKRQDSDNLVFLTNVV